MKLDLIELSNEHIGIQVMDMVLGLSVNCQGSCLSIFLQTCSNITGNCSCYIIKTGVGILVFDQIPLTIKSIFNPV